MAEYNITVYNDMGHLLLSNWNSIPKHISDFVYAKAKIYLLNATDNANLGCAFYILRDGLQNRWTYSNGRDIIKVFWNVDTFNPKTMKWIVPIYQNKKLEKFPLFI